MSHYSIESLNTVPACSVSEKRKFHPSLHFPVLLLLALTEYVISSLYTIDRVLPKHCH